MRQFLILSGMVIGITTFGTVGIYILNGGTWIESLYLAVVTLTTLGSRDVPKSEAAMLFIVFYLIVGLGIFSYGAFEIGQLIVNNNLRNVWDKRKMEKELSKLNQHFIICGIGRMGLTICEHLESKRKPFVIIDHDEELLEKLHEERRWNFVHGDATDDAVLLHAGIERARSLSTVLATDADNVYVVLSARLLSSKIQIVARASDDSAVQKLQRAGATRVISPFSSGAIKMARFMLSPSIENFLEFTQGKGEWEIVELEIHQNSPYVGQQLSQTDLRERGIMVIGIQRANGSHIPAPVGSVIIQEGDSLFSFGTSQTVSKLTGEIA